jgi:hypothetical protein
MNKSFLYIPGKIAILGLLSALLLGSCVSKRKLIKQPLKEYGEAFLIEKMQGSEARFEYLSARCNISLISNKVSTELKGQIRIHYDSVIWISLSPALGIEVARLMVGYDSIRFLNRLDKTYFEGDYELITGFLGTSIDFNMVQALILGNDFSYYENNTFRASIDSDAYKLSTTGRKKLRKYLKQSETPDILVQSLWLNPENYRITKIHLKEFGDENKRLHIEYLKHNFIEGIFVPVQMRLEVHQQNQRIEIMIDLNSVEINKLQAFPFKVPERYQKLK